MNKANDITFYGYKFFKTEFKFKNRNEKNLYWDKLAVNNPQMFRHKFYEHDYQKLHIINSYQRLMIQLAFVFLILSLFVIGSLSSYILFILSISSSITSYRLKTYFHKFYEKTMFSVYWYKENITDYCDGIKEYYITNNLEHLLYS